LPLQIFEYNGSAIGGSSQLDHSASLLSLFCSALLLATALVQPLCPRLHDAVAPPARCCVP
jgi:hypothetical protein